MSSGIKKDGGYSGKVFKKGNHPKSEFKKGHIPWSKGKKMSDGFKEKISNSKIGQMKGEKHWNWKGGKTKIYKHSDTGTFRYRQWRIKVFERDNWTCQNCGLRCHIGLGKSVYLEPHHIKSWTYYPKLRYEVSNGITLCKECHKLLLKKSCHLRQMKKPD